MDISHLFLYIQVGPGLDPSPKVDEKDEGTVEYNCLSNSQQTEITEKGEPTTGISPFSLGKRLVYVSITWRSDLAALVHIHNEGKGKRGPFPGRGMN